MKKQFKLIGLLLALLMVFSLVACSSSTKTDSSKEASSGYTVDAQATTLTVAAAGTKGKTYTADDLKKLGTKTYTYSGRNKKNDGARTTKEYTGVTLEALLKDAGCESTGKTLKMVASDGYTKEFKFDDINKLYAFSDAAGTDKTEVPAIIAITEVKDDAEYPSPFVLVYGQADYDSEDAKDFNMQNWCKYLQYIEVQ